MGGTRPSPIVCLLWRMRGKRAGWPALLLYGPNLRYGWREVVLTELFLARPDPSLGRRLFKQMMQHLQADYVAAHFAPGTLEQRIVRRSGFFRLPRQGMLFTVFPLQAACVTLMKSGAWDLTLGDLEIF